MWLRAVRQVSVMGGPVGKRIVTRKLYRQIVILFVLGSIVGLDCDQIHVQFAVLRYSNPDFWDSRGGWDLSMG